MADTKITGLLSPQVTTNPATDVLPIVNIADTLMASSGSTRKITVNQILGSGGTATLASATITGDLTVATSTLKVNSANNRVGIGTATPDNELSVRAASIATIDVRGGVGGAGGLKISGNGTTLGTTSFDLIQNSLGAIVYQRDALPLFFNVNGSERYAISSAGVATWSNVGGVAGTAMTLNSTGLGVGNASPAGALDLTNTGVTAEREIRIQNSTVRAFVGVEGTGGNKFVGSATNNAYFGTASTYGLEFATNNNVRMLIDTSGNVGVGVTPSAGKGCLQLSSGINFPATQVASTDANTLDDYEEGTWTGTIGGTTGNPTTPVTSTGRYTKIGRQVSVEIGFYGDTTGASGRITVSGLPFTSNASIARTGAIMMDTIGTFTGSPVAYLGGGVTVIDLYASNSNAGNSNVTHNAGAGRALYMELTYTV